jgi:hypothetical protein
MRAVSNSLLSFLLLLALLWGNCLSCPQLLLSLTSHAPAHDCCKQHGNPPANPQNHCQSLALKHFVKVDPAPKAQFQVVANVHVLSADATRAMRAPLQGAAVVILDSPPDLEVLNSSFRI